MSVAEPTERDVNYTLAVVFLLRCKGFSEEEIAKRLNFDSVEDMRVQLENWMLPGWLVGTKPNSGKKRNREKSPPPRLRYLGPRKDLPPAGNATELFRERLEALLESAELLKHVDESLHGRYFARTDVERAPVFYPREHYSKEEWDKVCEQHGLSPDDKGFWDANVVIRLPGELALSPSELEATLISVYALAGGQMDSLLDALHPDPSSVGAETRAKIHQLVEGSRRGKGTGDSLKVLARQLATLIRGSGVKRGRPPEISKMDYAVASITTKYRKDGLSDEEITSKVAHLKREDGTQYTIKDITELGNLNLSWS